ncbi:hypothetical protein GCM10014713_53820 [Streptomyces purpureus]|uniref:histidine kinase n=1 Tax=Streptomyces purpureus TaxID=1951 RepID=A0A918LU90_9ACTN|nr:hypothetical protein GCM10014713_53820 [Streptomyces purpureus]
MVAGTAAVAVACAGVAAAGSYVGLPAALAAGVLLAGAAGPRAWRRYAGRACAAVAAALLAVSALGAQGAGEAGSRWLFAAATALLALQAAAFRWAPVREVALGVGLSATALALWTQPLLPGVTFLERVGMGAFWTLPTLGAAVVGGYPRLRERRERLAVHDARRTQQLTLAHDLHDFVAHDISGIVAQAQAARFVAAQDPAAVLPALERIERAGLAALDSIDRTVSMLREAGTPAAREALPALAELDDLVRRFADSGATEARLTIAPDAADALSREAAATVHRIVTEALTNVRRHAPGAARVDITLVRQGRHVRLDVTNDTLPGPATARPRGGSGLLALTERVRALGGTFEAAPADGHWRTSATLPALGPTPGRTP